MPRDASELARRLAHNAEANDEPRYATSSITSFLPSNSTVSPPARAPLIASKIGAIVEIP